MAAIDGVCGAANLGLGAAHLVSVLSRAARGEGLGGADRFSYDFHFLSLLLVGLLLVIPGLLCLGQVRGLARGERSAWSVAAWSSLVLVALNGPLVPLQGFAPPLAGVAASNLAVLLLVRRRYGGRVADPAS